MNGAFVCGDRALLLCSDCFALISCVFVRSHSECVCYLSRLGLSLCLSQYVGQASMCWSCFLIVVSIPSFRAA